MNLEEIYRNQYSIARNKLNEKAQETWSDTLDKWQDRADMASLAGAGVALGAAATGVGAPVGAVASIGSTLVDLANAGVYTGRAVYDLAHGDVAKAKEHGFDAGLRALFAIPFIGDVAQAGRAAKIASSGEKAVATAAKSAPEVAAATAKAETSAINRGARRVGVPGERQVAAHTRGRAVPVREPATVPGKSRVVRQPSTPAKTTIRPIAKGVEKIAATDAAKEVGKTGLKGLSALRKTALGTGLGVLAKTIYDKATNTSTKLSPGLRPGDPTDNVFDTRSPVGVNLSKLGLFDTGDVALPGRSITSLPNMLSNREKFQPMWAINPQQRETLRTNYESYDPSDNLKIKVKSAVNKYLNSPQGYQLNKHLESIRKTLTSN